MTFTNRGSTLRGLTVSALAGILLARLGPFDTFSELPAGQRAAYWIGLTLLLGLQIIAARQLLTGTGRRMHPVFAAVAAGLVAAIPSAFEVAWAESLLRVERDLGAIDLVLIYFDVALIAVPLALAMGGVAGSAEPERPELETPRPQASGAREEPAFLASLDPERRGALLALGAEDHYLRVVTDRGEQLILHRFRDALAEVAGLEGTQVHRGWWVSRHAVQASERSLDRTWLVLTDGRRIPVSRSYAVAARQAGLLDR